MGDASEYHNDKPLFENQQISQNSDEFQLENDDILAELQSLKVSYDELCSKSMETENNLILILKEKEEALKQNKDLVTSLEEGLIQRNELQIELRRVEVSARERENDLIRQRDDVLREKGDFAVKIEESLSREQDLRNEIEILKEIESQFRDQISEFQVERSKKIRALSEESAVNGFIRECLMRIIGKFDEKKSINSSNEEETEAEELDFDEDSKKLLSETRNVYKLAVAVESQLMEYEEMTRKEKRELENSVVSLTEENRDISSLLRVALVEKEAVERTLNRLKGSGDQKRVAILQIAERGLQKVGFGFMMGSSTNDSMDNSGTSTGAKSDSSECEEEVVSLASTVEKIMKNLRLEITQLKKSLEESRADTERLQSLTEKQAERIAESTLYIKDLEEREIILAQNVEELLMEMAGAEEEVARWREACELEVEAGKGVVEERGRENAVLREELEKVRDALELSNSKVKLKEELAAAAMAAQEAAERSLRLVDSRCVGLRERIEELTRQLEEADSRGERPSGRRRVRHVCWPWHALRINPASGGRNLGRRMLPEMEVLLY